MFEFICIVNLFINVYLLTKEKKPTTRKSSVVASNIDKTVNNTSGLFNRLYGRF